MTRQKNPEFHYNYLIKALAALGASVLLSVAMNLEVRAEITAVVEVFTAFRARGRELARPFVDAAVVLVVAQLGELLATFGASERLFPRMRPAMNLPPRRYQCDQFIRRFARHGNELHKNSN